MIVTKKELEEILRESGGFQKNHPVVNEKLSTHFIQNSLSFKLCDIIDIAKNLIGEYNIGKFQNLKFSAKFLSELFSEKSNVASDLHTNNIKNGYLCQSAIENMLKSRNINKFSGEEIELFLYRYIEYKHKNDNNQLNFNEFVENLFSQKTGNQENHENSRVIEETPGIKV